MAVLGVALGDTHVKILKRFVDRIILVLDGDEADDKIIAVMEGDAAYGTWRDVADCPGKVIDRLQHYFLTYKDAPGAPRVHCQITHVYGREEAHEVIRRSMEDYRVRFGDLEGLLTTALRG